MKKLRLVLALGITFALSLLPLRAQGDQMNPASNIDPVLAKLMEGIKGFTATADVTVVESARNVETTLQCHYEYADSKFRADLDISKMKSADLPAEALPQLKMMGMAEFTTITRIDKGITYFIYPGLNAYAEMPTPGTKKETAKDSKIQVKELGAETVDGHPCLKKKVLGAGDANNPSEVYVWLAKDLKEFPVKVTIVDKKVAVTLVFKDIKLEIPATTRFEAPAGYTGYKNIQQMMQTEVMKKMGGMAR